MPKPKKINLNNYEIVDSIDDLDGYSGLIVIPEKLLDGTQPAEIYFRKQTNIVTISDVSNAVWFKDCRISQEGEHSDYIKRVDWWFKNALSDEEYKQLVNDTFREVVSAYNFDIMMSTRKAIAWLKSNGYQRSSRKTYLHKFYYGWLQKGANFAINAFNRNQNK